MNQNYLGKLLLAGAFIVSGSLQAQKTDVQKQAELKKIMADKRISDLQLSDERETPSFIQFDRKNPVPRYQAQYQLSEYLSLRSGVDELRNNKTSHTTPTLDVVEWKQYFKGVPVEQGVYRAIMQGPNALLMAGSYFNIPTSVNVRPTLTKQQALQFALQRVGATQYAWQQLENMIANENRPSVKQALQNELKDFQPDGELVIVKDFTKAGIAEMHLAYKFNIYASQPLSRDWIYVDAQSGKILFRNPIIHHASVNTTVATRYAGNRTIKVKEITGNDPNSGLPLASSHPGDAVSILLNQKAFVLIDDTRGDGMETYDMNGVGGLPISVPGIYAQGKSFTDVNNNWTLAEHKRGGGEGGALEAENDDIAWDAHWGAEMVYDYWGAKHQRLSYDGMNGKIKSFIHYGPAYDNAFWNGTAMTYGDGSGVAAGGFKALTSLDVCGHEIGHGVCSSTSDLAYQLESGAMNEALSDIWAACIEHYAATVIDPALDGIYRPFYIGEQISSTFDSPLRRMDAPKTAGNPDTYGGTNWTSVVNCTPTLANDQCGVHNNSGVLNKWFYLLTIGSGAGSGPDSRYRRADSDDGINDNGNTYTVNGVGFDQSEQVTFLMETMLSSGATYAEARLMSIAAATTISGNPCSSLVQSVTNAWYAVGVGAQFTSPCVTTLGFTQLVSNISETATNGAIGCNGVNSISIPLLVPANGTAIATLGGTATLGDDYTTSTLSFTNTSSEASLQKITVNVKDDAIVESPETITLNLVLTNAGTAPSNLNYTINITDNDVVPTIGNDSITLLSETFAGAPNGFGNPAGWTETIELNPSENQWAVNNEQIVITSNVLNVPGSYNPLSASQTRIARNAINDARGLSSLRLSFDYTVQGEVDVASLNTDIENTPVFDYLSIAYSLDGVNFTEFSTDSIKQYASILPASRHFSATLPSFLNNQQFYLAFRWTNDANAGGPVSVAIDNVVLKGLPKKIETVLNSFTSQNLVQGSDVYYYSTQDGDIIAKVNAGASTYGCTSALIEKAGNSTFTLFTNGTIANKVADKIVRLTPTTNNTSGTNTVSIYMTEQEIAGIEAGTLTGRNSLKLYKTSASNYTGANSFNTQSVNATYTPIMSGSTSVGGIFTGTFTTGFSAFAVGAPTSLILPVNCTDFTATQNAGIVSLLWKVAQEVNNKYFEVERSLDGSNFTVINKVDANAQNRGIYNLTDDKTANLKDAFYRIRQFDADGRNTYICRTVHVRFGTKTGFSISALYPNPVSSNGFVQINTDKALRIQADILSVAGQTIKTNSYYVAAGDNNVEVIKTKLPAGTYLIRFTDSENGTILKSQTFVQQ